MLDRDNLGGTPVHDAAEQGQVSQGDVITLPIIAICSSPQLSVQYDDELKTLYVTKT